MRRGAISFFSISFIVFLLFVCQKVRCQCTSPISTFPYIEGFEADNGGWITGGSNSWTWGIPGKPLINAAANGLNAWMVGGRTDPFYADAERSWLQSPCFDFSSLQNPVISFNAFWETEAGFDGASFQYSIDGGINWQNVGAASGDQDCFRDNWFNHASINNLSGLTSQRDGWSGNIQPSAGSCRGGDGLGEWVTSKHGLLDLAGKTSVSFRFIFGAGTTCNAYDGFAVDDILIEEAPPQTAAFTYACSGPNTIKFTNASVPCPTTFLWNFGDDLSGDNTSSVKDPTHIFSGPGTYTVTLIVNNNSTTTQSITIHEISASVINTTCKLSNGSINLSTLGGESPFQYDWTPSISTTSFANNIKSGNYSVTVTDSKGCAAIKNNIIVSNKGIPPTVFLGRDISICPGQEVELNAGDGYKSYVWQDNTIKTTYLVKIPGTYSVNVINDDNCTGTGIITINPTVNCTDIFFPASFTPDGNGTNDVFGPIGNLFAVSNYKLIIYNRWGQEVFASTNPYQKWRADLQGQGSNTGTFVWQATYTFNGTQIRTKKGFVTLIR